MKNSLILDKVMQLRRGKELLPFHIFPFPSLLYLPTFHRFSTFHLPLFPIPNYPTFLLPSLSLPQFLYSSFRLNLPLSLISLLFLFITYLLLFLSPSLLIPFPTYLLRFLPPLYLFRLPHPSLFPFFRCYPFPFILPLPLSFYPSLFPPFSFPFSFHFSLPFPFPFSFSSPPLGP